MEAIRPMPPHQGDRRPRWIVAELDVRGEIDAHAALCLHNAVDAAPADVGADVLVDVRDLTAIDDDGLRLLVDLRDLTAIDDDGLRLLVELRAGCRVRAIGLELLICGDAHHDAIAGAFDVAGLAYTRSAPRASAHSEPPPAARRTALPSPTAPISAASVALGSGSPRWGVMTAATSAVASA
jgi:anti-anti-sigma regulatory factor